MARVEVRSENVLLVKNSAFKWTLTWLFCFLILFVPAIFFLAAANQPVDSSSVRIPTWIGAVLLTFALMSFLVLLPFTIVTNTRMDKNLDSFRQEHQLLNCIPCVCYSSSEFALSEIVSIRVESFEDNFVGEGEDSQDRAQFSFGEGEDEYFESRYGMKSRSQVVVYFQHDSRPVTTFTSGTPSCLQVRSSRMTAHDIKTQLDRFLGLEVNVLEIKDGSQHPDDVSHDDLESFPRHSPIVGDEEAGQVSSLHAGVGQLDTPMGGMQVMEVPAYVRPRRKVEGLAGPEGAGGGKVQERMAYMEADTTISLPHGSRKVEELQVAHELNLPESPVEVQRAYPKKKKHESDEERRLRKALKKQALKDETPEQREARKELKKSRKNRADAGSVAAGGQDALESLEGFEHDGEGRGRGSGNEGESSDD